LKILAIDTTEARGSVCIFQGSQTVSESHRTNSDYSEWLLPAVVEVLRAVGVRMRDIDLLAVATGPGSFTGLRVGLTTVKAWAEVYGKPVIGVSRLEALARQQSAQDSFVAASYNAQRGQVFGALYQTSFGRLARIEDELVIAPTKFLNWVDQRAGDQKVSWVSLDPELLTSLPAWQMRIERGDTMTRCSPELAPAIAHLASERAQAGNFSDPLELDANYVRRSDAEIFWKRR
jgi:tRNA threonylcarbamoyladenosine biosynthesis protein TsaB